MKGAGRRDLCAAAAAAALLLTACGGGGSHPATHTVRIEAMRFEPQHLVVAPGDTIVWRNEDLVPHTASASGAFESGEVSAGGSWRWTAPDTGRFDYVCRFHPTMMGEVRVRR